MAESVEEGTNQQRDTQGTQDTQDTPSQNTEDVITLQRSTLIITATIIAVIILALLGGDVIIGYRLMEVTDLLNKDVDEQFVSLSREEGLLSLDAWRWIKEAKADMTLNPQSAHYLLQVSSDGKSLYQRPLDSPPPASTNETYKLCICVSSANLLNTRAYFELKVSQYVPWTLGLRTESFDADSNPDTDPETGIWTIASEDGKIIINDGKPTPTRHVTPTRLGLYLDYSQGQVSFYDAVAERHLHTYLTTFKEKLRFYASIGVGMAETDAVFISFV